LGTIVISLRHWCTFYAFNMNRLWKRIMEWCGRRLGGMKRMQASVKSCLSIAFWHGLSISKCNGGQTLKHYCNCSTVMFAHYYHYCISYSIKPNLCTLCFSVKLTIRSAALFTCYLLNLILTIEAPFSLLLSLLLVWAVGSTWLIKQIISNAQSNYAQI